MKREIPKIYKPQNLDASDPIWKKFPQSEDHAYSAGGDTESASRNVANGSTPRDKLSIASFLARLYITVFSFARHKYSFNLLFGYHYVFTL